MAQASKVSDALVFRFGYHGQERFDQIDPQTPFRGDNNSSNNRPSRSGVDQSTTLPPLITDMMFLQYSVSLLPPPESAAPGGVDREAFSTIFERIVTPRVRTAMTTDCGKASLPRLQASAASTTPEEVLAAVSGVPAPFSTTKASAVLQMNSKKPMGECVSTLTLAQHQHYRDWIIQFQASGRKPSATLVPDFQSVADVVGKEQSSYMKKLKENIMRCDLCSTTPNMPGSPSHVCQNHNFLLPEIEAWYRLCIGKKHAAELAELVSCGKRQGAKANHKKKAVVMVLSKAILGEADATAMSIGGRPQVIGSQTIPVPSRRHSASAKSSASPRRNRGKRVEAKASDDLLAPSAGIKTRIFGSAVIPPSSSRRLPVQDLPKPTGGEEESPGPLTLHALMTKAAISQLPTTCDQQQHTLVLSASALFAIATSHASSFRAAFTLPIIVTPSGVKEGGGGVSLLEVSVQKPLKSLETALPRKHMMTAGFKRLVSSASQLFYGKSSSSSNCTVEEGEKEEEVVALTELQLPEGSHPKGTRVFLRCHCTSIESTNRKSLVYTMVKPEYNHKGPDVKQAGDDPAAFRLEAFSTEEVIRMMLLLHSIPDLSIHIHRVCAYTQCVLAVEEVTKVSFATSVLPHYIQSAPVRVVWQVVNSFITSLMAYLVDTGSGSLNALSSECVLVVRKVRGERDFTIGSVATEAGDGILSSAEVESALKSECRVEPAPSAEVCKREYNPPCVWPFSPRIPFTFEPAGDGAPRPPSAKVEYELCLLK